MSTRNPNDEVVVQQMVVDLRVLDHIRAAERNGDDTEHSVAIPQELESAIASPSQWIDLVADGDSLVAGTAAKLADGRLGLNGRSLLAVTDAMFDAAGSLHELESWATPQRVAAWQNTAWSRVAGTGIDSRVSRSEWDGRLDGLLSRSDWDDRFAGIPDQLQRSLPLAPTPTSTSQEQQPSQSVSVQSGHARRFGERVKWSLQSPPAESLVISTSHTVGLFATGLVLSASSAILFLFEAISGSGLDDTIVTEACLSVLAESLCRNELAAGWSLYRITAAFLCLASVSLALTCADRIATAPTERRVTFDSVGSEILMSCRWWNILTRQSASSLKGAGEITMAELGEHAYQVQMTEGIAVSGRMRLDDANRLQRALWDHLNRDQTA